MSDILLAAVNARFNHTNIAVRSISLYINKPELVKFDEWTINQPILEILRGIASYSPKIIMFSTYIWNIDIVVKLIRELPKIIPDCIVCAGGPEAGFRAEQILEQETSLDLIIAGEGEQTCKELTELYVSEKNKFNKSEFLNKASKIKGVYSKITSSDKSEITFGGERCLISDMSVLPFPYPQITDPDNRIYYYESSRGCPFSCAYCMSSLDTRVRFMPLERVYADIQKFLDAKVKLVKFVDRTYNLDAERYIAIWKYIFSHHNNYTMFHFEIEAEFLSTEALDFIQNIPSGIMQFEIGVQTIHAKTLKAVHRSTDVEKIAANVRKIPKTIHTHLDLIAGLPYEDIKNFGESFDWVLALTPDALQLGFLKVLYGTSMEDYCKKNGWKWMCDAPYEVLSTPFMSYDDIQFLKDVETLLDAFWNSHNFDFLMHYIQPKISIWNFFCSLVKYCRIKNVFSLPRTSSFWYELMHEYITCNEIISKEKIIMLELLRFDFISSGKKGNFPAWCNHNYDKEAHRKALEQYIDFKSTRTAYSFSEYDIFDINPTAPDKSEPGKKYAILFLYPESKSQTIRYIFL